MTVENPPKAFTHFVFVLETGFTMQALSSGIEALRLARKLGAQDQLAYSVAGQQEEPISASNGVSIVPDHSFSTLPRDAVLVVVSGAGTISQPNPHLIAKLRLWARRGFKIWGVSSGVVRLAQAGLIDKCRVAAHWEDVPYLRENHPNVELVSTLFVTEGKHPTCAGGGAAADLMMSYIKTHISPDFALDLTSRLMIDGVRDGRVMRAPPTQLRYSTANKTVFAAMRLMEANTFEALSLLDVARRVGVSQRQLERLFQAEFGKTPASVYSEVRLTEARQEVLARHRTLVDIAVDYGFQPGTFAKVYRRVFGLLPSEDRKKQESRASV